MKTKAVFYHAGCPVCVDAEQMVTETIDKNRYEIEIVNLGTEKNRINEAETAGVKSVPALVIEANTYHINFGAEMSALK